MAGVKDEQGGTAFDEGDEVEEVRSQGGRSANSSDSDADYDTDLEPAEAGEQEKTTTDLVRVDDYLEACTNGHAIPQSVVLRGLGNRDLDLSHRNLGSHQLKPLFQALKDNMRVQRLILKEVGLDKHGAKALASGLMENVTLSYLSLAGNPLGREGLYYVVFLLLANNIIQIVDLSDSKLGSDAVPLLSHLLMNSTTLRFLDLARNALEDTGMRALAAAIGENTSLEFLRLAWNRIRLSGASAIGQCLTVNRHLRMLDLSWNGLGYQGAVALARSLPQSTTLRELDVSYNRINWQGAQVLATGLAKNSTLVTLRLGNNPLTTTGAMDLVEAVSSPHCALRLLDLTNVPVIAETDVLAASLRLSRGFKLIHGGVVFIHDVFGRRLEREKTPMEKLLQHLRTRMIRPLEMLREFDKTRAGQLSENDFSKRLKRANIPLHDFEISALAASIAEMRVDRNKNINYSMLMESIEKHVMQDRTRKWREQMRQRRVREYNTRILEDGKPMYYTSNASTATATSTPLDAALMSMSSFASSKPSVTAKSGRSSSPLTFVSYFDRLKQMPAANKLPKLKSKAAFSMSVPLNEIGRKKKRVRKDKSRLRAFPVPREATTLVGVSK